jgi:hypothetical protein
MEIDFAKPWTDEAKAYLKANLGKIEEATGVVTLDPKEPLSRTAMEQLKIHHKIAGQDEDFSVWDGVQRAAKAGGADKAMKDAKDALAYKAAADRIREANVNGATPSDEDVNLVLGGLHPDPQSLLHEDDEQPAKGKGSKAKASAGDDIEQRINAAVAAYDKKLRDSGLLLRTPHHGMFLDEQLGGEANRIINEAAKKAVANDPKRKAVEAKIGKDPNRRAIMDVYDKTCIDTVVSQARGRMKELQGQDGADILAEMPKIAEGIVATMDPQAMIDRAAPQPILLGGSSPDDMPLRVLSTDEPPARPKLDDADFEDKMAQRWAHRTAKEAAAAASP